MLKMCRINKKFVIACLLLLACAVFMSVPEFVQAQAASTAPGGEAPQTAWDYIRQRTWITTIWRFSLGLVDLVVVFGLLIAAFSNIFRINIKSYEIKQVLPGLIIGIILANLSYFIMQFMLQAGSISIQLIAEMVGNIIGISPGTEKGGVFIMVELAKAIQKSVTYFPHQILGQTVVTGTVLGAGIIGLSGLGIIVAILLLLFALGPYVIYYVLVFLLYARNFVLILAFMTAPLAFFAAGFPPFRSMWQKWWSTFWKWLLMAPVAHIVLAMGLIFLHFANEGIGESTTRAGRGLVEYLFVNGIGIAILYFATRIPFMWGSLFGFNAMKEWAKYGKESAKLAHKGLKSGTDLATVHGGRMLFKTQHGDIKDKIVKDPAGTHVGDIGAIKGRLDDATYADEKTRAKMKKKAESIYNDVIAKTGGVAGVGGDVAKATEAANRYVNSAMAKEYSSAYQKSGTDARNKWNVFRAPESIQAGWKERVSNWNSDEEKAVKQNAAYGHMAGKVAKDKATLERHGNTYKEIDDESELFDAIEPLAKGWTEVGCDPRALTALFDRGDIINDREYNDCLKKVMEWSKNNPDPAYKGRVTKDSLLEMKQAGNRLMKVIRPSNVRDAKDAQIKSHYPGISDAKEIISSKSDALTYMIRYSDEFAFAGATPGAVSAAGFVAGGTHDLDPNLSVAGMPSLNYIQQLLAAEGQQAVANYAKSIIQTMPHTAIAASQEAYKASQRELQKALADQGLDDHQASAIINSVYQRIQKNMGGITAQELDSLAGRALDHETLRPHIITYRDRTKDMNEVLHKSEEYASASAADLPLQGHVAEYMVKQSQGNVQATKDKLNALLQQAQTAGSSQALDEVYKGVKEMTGDTGLTLQSTNAEDLRKAIDASLNRAQEAVKILETPTVSAAAATQNTAALSKAIDHAISQKMMAHHAVVTAGQMADRIDPTALANAIGDTLRNTVVDYSADMKAQYDAAAEAERAQYDAVINDVAGKLHESFMATKEAGGKVHVALNDNNEAQKVQLRDYVERALMEGFSKVKPPQPQEQTQPQTPENPQA